MTTAPHNAQVLNGLKKVIWYDMYDDFIQNPTLYMLDLWCFAINNILIATMLTDYIQTYQWHECNIGCCQLYEYQRQRDTGANFQVVLETGKCDNR